ncbi:MAG TPA: hypothetical protein VI750_14675 [Pyrinomonadaceae bacterium]|nr:hypothetical protein [Pyrinomonadaceae bacterium]
MPLGKGIRYRYKKGTKIRLAFKGNRVVEAKNMTSGKVHTPGEFAEDRKARAKKVLSHR